MLLYYHANLAIEGDANMDLNFINDPGISLPQKKKSNRKPRASECGLKIFYQPIVQPMFNKTTAYEAQVKLVDRDLGYVSYDELLPITEKSKISALLEQWMFEEICSTVQKMDKKEIEFEYVSVNISVRSLKKKNYISNLLKIISDAGVSPEKICLVISENNLNADTDVIIEKMHELKREGFKIAVGNYSASYMPLSKLDSVPTDLIKLDQTITDRLFIDKKTEENAMAIIHHADKLKLEIVAKSVENEMQKYKLMALGCNKMQGFLFGSPVKDREVLNPKPYNKIMCTV